MKRPKVSIIIPVYNAEKFLDRCINSITNQTLREIEIILVDDSSTDSSLEICRAAAEKDSRIRVIHKANGGAGMARNEGLKIAAGEYIGFVDSDDFIAEDMYETLYNKARKYDSDLVMSGVLFADGIMFGKEGECICRTCFEKDTHFDDPDSLKELKTGIVGAAPGDPEDSKYGMSIWKNLFKNEIIKKNNIVFQSEREMLSEDALFMVDYISCIGRATGIPGAFYNYCRNGDSVSKSYKNDRFEKSLVFVSEVEKRFQKDMTPKEYRIYIDRFWQAMCRVICVQEIMHAEETGVKYAELKKRLKAVCTHDFTVSSLKSYPIGTLPLKQAVFAFGMKYRLYLLLVVLVKLRSK